MVMFGRQGCLCMNSDRHFWVDIHFWNKKSFKFETDESLAVKPNFLVDKQETFKKFHSVAKNFVSIESLLDPIKWDSLKI